LPPGRRWYTTIPITIIATMPSAMTTIRTIVELSPSPSPPELEEVSCPSDVGGSVGGKVGDDAGLDVGLDVGLGVGLGVGAWIGEGVGEGVGEKVPPDVVGSVVVGIEAGADVIDGVVVSDRLAHGGVSSGTAQTHDPSSTVASTS